MLRRECSSIRMRLPRPTQRTGPICLLISMSPPSLSKNISPHFALPRRVFTALCRCPSTPLHLADAAITTKMVEFSKCF